jgi:type I restriction enzyme R subunit
LADDQARQEFVDRLRGFVRAYAFLSQIIPYADPELEMLYSFGRFLLPHLQADKGTPVRLSDEVALEYYRADRTFSGAIDLRDGDPALLKPSNDVGTGKANDPPAPLSQIIKALNERFGTDFSEEDRLFFRQIEERAVKDEHIADTARANPLDKFKVGVRKAIEGMLVQRAADNDAIVTRYLEDEAFQQVVFDGLAKAIFASVRGTHPDGGRSDQPANY